MKAVSRVISKKTLVGMENILLLFFFLFVSGNICQSKKRSLIFKRCDSSMVVVTKPIILLLRPGATT